MSREGWPGPEPARMMRPRGAGVEDVGDEGAGEAVPGYVLRMVSTSESAIEARRFKGQYSHTCASHLILLVFSSSLSSSFFTPTSLLNVAPCPILSSVSSSSGNVPAPSASWTRFLISPRRAQASPRLWGREEEMSRRMREASLQPRPFVVTPIWRGPSVCVERRVKVQRDGESTTLTGIRLRRHSWEMCVARRRGWLEASFIDRRWKMVGAILTKWFSWSRGHEDSIDHKPNFLPSQSE